MYYPEDLIFLRTVGVGSFGKVVKVKSKGRLEKSKIYALKLIKKDILIDQLQFENIKNEISIYQEINGEIYFPKIYDTFFARDRYCILTDFCEGGELFQFINRLNGLTIEQVKFFACEILMGLRSLHRKNIIYRDLKAENVLLTKDGHIKLVDFDLSVKTKGLVQGEAGTLECMAPEVLKGEFYGKEIDYWSFGILLYEMYTCKTPFYDIDEDVIINKILNSEANLSHINDDIFVDLLSNLLQKNPLKRLGARKGIEEIVQHPFFSKVNWSKVRNYEIKPPINTNILKDGENYPFHRESIYTLLSFK